VSFCCSSCDAISLLDCTALHCVPSVASCPCTRPTSTSLGTTRSGAASKWRHRTIKDDQFRPKLDSIRQSRKAKSESCPRGRTRSWTGRRSQSRGRRLRRLRRKQMTHFPAQLQIWPLFGLFLRGRNATEQNWSAFNCRLGPFDLEQERGTDLVVAHTPSSTILKSHF
jgi:hypothetical protein